MVVVQSVEKRSLPTPEGHRSNPVIGKSLYRTFASVICGCEKTKIKKKRPGMPIFKKTLKPILSIGTM